MKPLNFRSRYPKKLSKVGRARTEAYWQMAAGADSGPAGPKPAVKSEALPTPAPKERKT